MASHQTQNSSALEYLSRLSSKPSVQSTLVLSKKSGAIIHSTGLLSASSSSPPEAAELGRSLVGPEGGLNAEAVARLVFSFVSAGGDLAGCLEEGGDAQLLRLRTRRNEIVIAPG